MERVSDEFLEFHMKYPFSYCPANRDLLMLTKDEFRSMAEELLEHRKAEKEHGHTDHSTSEKDGAVETQEKVVLPIPCTKGFENWTVKQWFSKINEELDEMKEAMLRWSDLDSVSLDCDYVEKSDIALVDEAADTITAITSMLEAMGIDERQRQAAQERVNEHNRERGRF